MQRCGAARAYPGSLHLHAPTKVPARTTSGCRQEYEQRQWSTAGPVKEAPASPGCHHAWLPHTSCRLRRAMPTLRQVSLAGRTTGRGTEAVPGSVCPTRRAKTSWAACKGRRGTSALCLVLATGQWSPNSLQLHTSAPSTGHDEYRAIERARGDVGRLARLWGRHSPRYP